MDEKKLEIGCGRNPMPGFMRMDGNPEIPGLDYCGLAQDPLPWADGTFSEIRAIDVLEHIPYRLTLPTLREWGRVLRPGGKAFIQVPDAKTAMKRWMSRPSEIITPEFAEVPSIVSLAWRLLGGQDDGDYSQEGDDWRWNAHYALFDSSALMWYLKEAGFKVLSIQTNPFPNLQCWAEKL